MTQDSLAALRAEVEAAFEEATLQLGALIETTSEISVADLEAVVAPEVPTPVASSPPPPPPPPPSIPVASEPVAPSTVWESAMGNDDPLVAFAPPPRMDWGPERQRRFRRFR